MDHCPSGLICAYARFELTLLLTGFASREVRTIGGLTRQRSRNLRSESVGRDNASDAGLDWRLSTGVQSRKQMLPEMAARPWHAPLRPDSGRDLLRTSSKLQVSYFGIFSPCRSRVINLHQSYQAAADRSSETQTRLIVTLCKPRVQQPLVLYSMFSNYLR